MNSRAACFAFLLVAPLAAAINVTPENLTVSGSYCVGFDCSNGENFTQSAGAQPDVTIRLKENNTRLDFVDTTAGVTFIEWTTATSVAGGYYLRGELGQGWSMEANQSANGGLSQFMFSRFTPQSADLLSDGSAIDYQCLLSGITTLVDPAPAGDPVKVPVFNALLYAATGEEQCVLLQDYNSVQTNVTSLPAMVLAPVNGTPGQPTAVLLGMAADRLGQGISLGSDSAPRRLAHLADAIHDLDVVTKTQFQSLPYAAQKVLIVALDTELAALESRVTELEALVQVGGDADTDGDADAGGTGRRSSGGGLFASGLLLLLLVIAGMNRRQA